MRYQTEEGKPIQVLFSVKQTAEILGIGRTKVFELLASGTLGSVTIGSRRLVPLSEIEAYVQRLMHPNEWPPDLGPHRGDHQTCEGGYPRNADRGSGARWNDGLATPTDCE